MNRSIMNRIFMLQILSLRIIFKHFCSVQLLSRVRLFVTLWIAARQASLSITISKSSLRLMSIESVMPSSHLILGRPFLLLPPIPPSIRVFSSESALRMRRPKYWSFSFSISASNEHPGLISLRMDWLDLLSVQGILKSLLQHHSSKASVLWHSALFGAGGEGNNKGWDGWMVSPTQWTWVWVNSRSWWWTGRPGVLQFIGSQRVGHDWATELNRNVWK